MQPAYFDPESKFLVLDLLIDGPGSFLSLYGELTRFHAFPPDVNLLMSHLEAHEADGHIELLVSGGADELAKPSHDDRSRAREQYQELIRRRPDDFIADEIGFWYYITAAGRDVWHQTAMLSPHDETPEAPWVIEEDAVARILVVYASTRDAAEAALEKLRLNTPGLAIVPGSAVIQDIESFKPATGGEVRPAVRLTARYSSES
jgi:hypothetical protein